MSRQKVKDLVEEVLKDSSLPVKHYGLIKNETILREIEKNKKDSGLLCEICDDEVFYPILKELQNKYNIKLFHEKLTKDINVFLAGRPGEKNIRAAEALGYAFTHLKSFYRKAKEQKATIVALPAPERGYVFSVKLKEGSYVIKRYENVVNEPKIAKIASDIGVGPKIEEMGRGWFVEEFIPGNALEYQKNTRVKDVAQSLGKIVGLLHNQGIIYHDSFERHLYINNKKPILIDYGSAFFGIKVYIDIWRIQGYRDTKYFWGHFNKAYFKYKYKASL